MDRIIEKKFWTAKRAVLIPAGGIMFMLLIYTLLFGDRSSRLNVKQDRLTIEEVRTGVFQDYISVTGTVLPIKTIYLDAVEGGIVDDILVDEGGMVEQGEVILRLTNTNLRINIMNLETSLTEQMNNLRNTRLQMEQHKLSLRQQIMELDYLVSQEKKNYENNKVMHEKDFVSDRKYEDARDKYRYLVEKKDLLFESQKQDSLYREVQIKQLEGSVQRMQEHLQLVRQKEEYLNLTAPIGGQLTMLNAEIGELKSSGEHIGQISVLDAFKIRSDIDEYFISRIFVDLNAGFEYDGQNYALKVKKIYPEVRNGRFAVDMVFSGPFPEKIRTGQTFTVNLELGESKTAVLVPRGGFYQSTGGQFIYVLNPAGAVAEKRDIRLGRQNPKYYEVLEGLEPGEKVIVSGYDTFGDMDKLIIK